MTRTVIKMWMALFGKDNTCPLLCKKKLTIFIEEFTREGKVECWRNVYRARGKLSKIHPSFCSRQNDRILFMGCVYLTASYTRQLRRTKARAIFRRAANGFRGQCRKRASIIISPFRVTNKHSETVRAAVVQLNSAETQFSIVRMCAVRTYVRRNSTLLKYSSNGALVMRPSRTALASSARRYSVLIFIVRDWQSTRATRTEPTFRGK